DDNTKVDASMTPSGVNNRTFSYLTGDAQNKIYVDGAWRSGQQAAFPTHSPSMSPSAGENWYANPAVSEQQIYVIGTTINECGIAPESTYTADETDLGAGGNVNFTVTVSNPVGNVAVDVTSV